MLCWGWGEWCEVGVVVATLLQPSRAGVGQNSASGVRISWSSAVGRVWDLAL